MQGNTRERHVSAMLQIKKALVEQRLGMFSFLDRAISIHPLKCNTWISSYAILLNTRQAFLREFMYYNQLLNLALTTFQLQDPNQISNCMLRF